MKYRWQNSPRLFNIVYLTTGSILLSLNALMLIDKIPVRYLQCSLWPHSASCKHCRKAQKTCKIVVCVWDHSAKARHFNNRESGSSTPPAATKHFRCGRERHKNCVCLSSPVRPVAIDSPLPDNAHNDPRIRQQTRRRSYPPVCALIMMTMVTSFLTGKSEVTAIIEAPGDILCGIGIQQLPTKVHVLRNAIDRENKYIGSVVICNPPRTGISHIACLLE